MSGPGPLCLATFISLPSNAHHPPWCGMLLLLLLLLCQVVTATVDLDEVVSFRASISSLREQASTTTKPAFVCVDYKLCRATGLVDPPRPVRVRQHPHEQGAGWWDHADGLQLMPAPWGLTSGPSPGRQWLL
jgi:hypothetical protein